MKNYIRYCADVECNSPIFFSFFLRNSDHFYVLTVGAEGYCDTSSLSMTYTHTHTHTQIGRNPLDEGSARRRDLYLTTHNRQTSMPPTGFELAIPASERPQTHSLDRAASHVLIG
jgi:hypothetical protein